MTGALSPDVLCLQETKVTDGLFPGQALAALGYPHQAFHGMKGYNGVAILSRLPLTGVRAEPWPQGNNNWGDCRHIHAALDGDGPFSGIEIHSLYIPAGGDRPNPETNPKFAHKLAFLSSLTEWFQDRAKRVPRMVAAGDFNVAPLKTDVWSHDKLKYVVTHTAAEIERLSALRASARWIDTHRHFVAKEKRVYTWWSYRTPDWNVANKGRRLDHIWVTPPLKGNLGDVSVLREARGWETPSDHVPLTLDLEIGS